MQFSLVTVLAIVGVVAAAGSPKVVPRQAANARPDVAAPAMKDANGNVVPFQAAGVYKDATDRGQ